MITESELFLISKLGVYGIWLCRYAKDLPQIRINSIKESYKDFYDNEDDKYNARFSLLLMDTIDSYCRKWNHPAPGPDYETALKELKEFRNG